MKSQFTVRHGGPHTFGGSYCVARFTGNELSGEILIGLARDMGWTLSDVIVEVYTEETYGGTSTYLEVWSRQRCAECRGKTP